MRTSTVFKSRWMALIWAAGILWFAYDFAAPSDDSSNTTNAEQPTDATGAPVTSDDANNIRNALNIISSENVEVLLCDIGLPDGTGYEVIAEAKRKQRIKSVAITGFGTEEDIRRFKEAGFDLHLVKPIDLHELQEVLDQVGAERA